MREVAILSLRAEFYQERSERLAFTEVGMPAHFRTRAS